MANILYSYKNGNYHVTIFDDGTKVRDTPDNEFYPEFPESIDMSITNYCDIGCPYCYADCTVNGKDANLKKYERLLSTIHPYTELALQVNAFSNKDLDSLLEMMKDKKVICNITVNQKHFEKYYDYIEKLVFDNLIKGIGISVTSPTDDLIYKIQRFDNAVIHVINGIFSKEVYNKLKGNDLKLLILGYKYIGRGYKHFIHDAQDIRPYIFLKDNIGQIIKSDDFKVLSFDNLALEQLNIKNILSKEEFDNLYMGDDGRFSMYVDLVNGYFSKSSISKEKYDIDNLSIQDCFLKLQHYLGNKN